MNYTRMLASCMIACLATMGACAFADDSKKGLELLERSGWFSVSASIQELRERSTKSFELIDENQSGSITLDEIAPSQMETDMSKMNPNELRQNSQRMHAISRKFMIWSEEVDEFEIVDTNNDGVWNKEEYEARRKNLNLHRLELGLQQWDKDGNNAVELHEFNSHLDELEILDEDGDGTVSREEAFKSENRDVITDVLMQQLKFDQIFVGDLEAIEAEAAVRQAETEVRVFSVKEKEIN